MDKLSLQDNLHMRRTFLGRSCPLHFEAAPLKITRGSKQYMYDEFGNEYLDCINYTAHVGHCHPHVVAAGQEQMGKLCTAQGFLSDKLSLYAKRLVETLPEKLRVCFFLNSGSEANDLALRLAKEYTKGQDIVVVDNAFHGNIASLVELSPLSLKTERSMKKDYVHIVPCPDTYRGKYREDTLDPGQRYAQEVAVVLDDLQNKGRKLAAFLSEPTMALCGVIVPPAGYLKSVYRMVQSSGGLCIADEVAVGLGRTGENYWAFQAHSVVPDILTCGKPMGNGYPVSVVVTTQEIAACLPHFFSGLGGNPVSCAVGLAVMDVIENEQLLSSTKCVGRTLMEGFRGVQAKHPMMGDIRGCGLVVGVEIVTDRESRNPDSQAAELLSYKLKQEKILMSARGPDKNVMVIMPPLCFTCDNARRTVQAVDRMLTEIESGACSDELQKIYSALPAEARESKLIIPAGVLNGGDFNSAFNDDDDDDDDEQDSGQQKRRRFEDLD